MRMPLCLRMENKLLNSRRHPTMVMKSCCNGFDEYDAGRPDVMFVPKILEVDGKLTLLDQNTVIAPPLRSFRLFATTNTVGLDTSGLYHGTQQINQGRMDGGMSFQH